MKRLVKCLCTLLFLTFILSEMCAFASGVKILIPSYKCIINNSDVYYKDSQYPLISYKDITYFPMTYEYSRALNLSTSWTGSELYIAYHQTEGVLPIYKTVRNSKYNNAVIPTYPIFINGEKIDNTKEEYPLLNFRGVTYFPMTWRFATEEFNWTTSWENNIFTLDSSQTIYNSISQTYPIDEKTAFIFSSISHEVEISPNVFTNTNLNKFYKFDYDSEVLSETTLEEMGINDLTQFLKEREQGNLSFDLKTDNGKIFIDGIELKEITYLIENDLPDASVSCSGTELRGVKTYSVTILKDNKIPAPYTPKVSYNFIRFGDKFVLVDMDAYMKGLAPLSDGSVYVNTRKHLGYKGWVKRASTLYKVTENGDVTKINTSYNSMKIVGKAEDKLYLLCEWGNNDNPVSGTYEISASNDGYFTLDKNGKLTKIANFVSSYQNGDYDFVSPSGKLFIFTPIKREIKRIY